MGTLIKGGSSIALNWPEIFDHLILKEKSATVSDISLHLVTELQGESQMNRDQVISFITKT